MSMETVLNPWGGCVGGEVLLCDVIKRDAKSVMFGMILVEKEESEFEI